jgi:plastocyanin
MGSMAIGTVNWRRRVGMALIAAIAVLSLAGLRAAAGESATVSRAGSATQKIVDFEFQPTPLRVGVGTRVVFANRGMVVHTATANAGGFDTGEIKPGNSKAVSFKRAGTFLFHCEFHPFMHGKIVVK